MPAPPPVPPRPKSLSLPPPKGLASTLTSVEDEPEDPTRLMDRRPAPPPVPPTRDFASSSRHAVESASIFNSPTKILPRVRSGGVLGAVGANLAAYTRRPTVNLALLLLAGLLLVGLGFVLGAARKEPREAPPSSGPAATGKTAPESTVASAAPPAPVSAPVSAIAVSSLPLAPPLAPAKELNASGRTGAGSNAGRAASTDFALQPDRPPTVESGEPKKGYVAPIRNPGF